MNEIVWGVIKQVYAKLLRPILKKAVDDPEAKWDDWLMRFVDNLFEYDGTS